MHLKLNSVQIRLGSVCGREFERDVYRPGVISLSRLVWGSVGVGLQLTLLAVLSKSLDIPVLFPPLAATCFINCTCVYLRVARPKPVIVGHFVSAICGLAGVWLGKLLAGGTELALPLQLGLSILFAAVMMQVFDADHPPAAATAVIPALLPLPMPPEMFPIYMAWGATFTILFTLSWNRFWFEYPARDDDHRTRYAGLFMEKPQVWGVGLCVAGFSLMSCRQSIPALYAGGLWSMTAGVLVMGLHHLWAFCVAGATDKC